MRPSLVAMALWGIALATTHPGASFAQTANPAGLDNSSASQEQINWKKLPGKRELGYVEPDRAQRMEQNGDASMRCDLAAAGRLGACEIVSDVPQGFGFGAALLKLQKVFEAAPSTHDRKVLISVHWDYRGQSTVATAVAPVN